MRKKLLFMGIMTMMVGALMAQDTIKSLVITEARLDEARQSYWEITNMSDEVINLMEFEFGRITPWNLPYEAPEDEWIIIGEYIKTYKPSLDTLLQPGESFVAAAVHEFEAEMWLIDPQNYNERMTKEEWWEMEDDVLLIHKSELNSNENDSISANQIIWETFGGRDCWYLRHHLPNGDSAVVDVVNGVFDDPDRPGYNQDAPNDVAGFADGTFEATLIRKYSVKEGNLDFYNARGLDRDDSEWIPIEHLYQDWEPWRALFWTVGNHGDYNLDETTLVSSTLDIDYANQKITVPWGTRGLDAIMDQMEKKPGIAWHYDLAPTSEDSAYASARTGDKLTVYVAGADLDEMTFDIEVAPPTDDANIVMPMYPKAMDDLWGNILGKYGPNVISGHQEVYLVTEGYDPDTIWNIGYASRVDSLFKYLEKAPEATWEIVWVDGMERPDLKHGDMLKVTAKSGAVKEYFIKVQEYRPDDNALLDRITWPDIPEFYKGIYGWVGDTIPGFTPTKFNYNIQVPFDVEGIPALVAHAQEPNAKIEVKRATNILGDVDARTITFTVTAEDDSTVNIYNITLNKEKMPDQIQQWEGEPFISEFIFWGQWSNGFVEIANPGTKPLDLSDYMMVFLWSNDPVEALTWNNEAESWLTRYVKYIPGYKWQTETEWQVEPRIAVQDLNVNAWVQPGDVFLMGDIRATGQSGYPWFASEQLDIDFFNNPWDEEVGDGTAARQWTGANFYMYKILNDSIKAGTKPATDPADFELIETFGSGDGSPWVVSGVESQMINSWVRKPEFYTPKPGFNESFGTNADDSEWMPVKDIAFNNARGFYWPLDVVMIADDLGKHFMNDVTQYRSYVTSLVYKVSRGVTNNELIKGLVTGVSVDEFLPDINKVDEGQSLTLKSSTDGAELSGADVLMNGDTLVVLSADSVNITKYVLEVTDDGLSDDALLTSSTYDIQVDGASGSVGGFDYGTALSAIVQGVQVPAGASLNVIDGNNLYVPLLVLNFDTIYVDVKVSDQIYFEVIAEDGITIITYQLKPNSEASDAFVLSDVYEVDQETKLISLVPEGTTVGAFYKNLTPATGASMQVKDKMGLDRMDGVLYKDDKLTVTAQDAVTQGTYFLGLLEEDINYLAYVTSNVYLVDQVKQEISGDMLNMSTPVAEFVGNLVPAPSATISVLDANMAEKADGAMDEGDLLEVVAGDGVTVTYYNTVMSTVSTNDLMESGINLYPNPSNGQVRISGLEAGNRIQVYNSVGVRVLEKAAYSPEEVIHLEEQGLYFVVVNDGEGVLGHYKLIVK